MIIIISALGGVIGGMGMGGGTLLIPLLTLGAGVEQHLAQAINLIAFVPMSITALFIHRKNGYVDVKNSWVIAIVALVGAVGGSLLSAHAGGYVLRACYGAFLIALGAVQLFKAVFTTIKNRKIKKATAQTA